MNIESLRSICLSYPAVVEDIKWENHLCFNVGGKLFMITSPDESPVTASFKAVETDFDLLTETEGFMPAPYLARYKWVRVDDIGRLSAAQWKTYSRKAYELVATKLPATQKRALGIPKSFE